MGSGVMWLIGLFAVTAVLMAITGLFGNFFVDRASNAINRKQAEKYNREHAGESEKLADRFKKNQ